MQCSEMTGVYIEEASHTNEMLIKLERCLVKADR